jgi:hypothetical protein
VAVSSAQIGLFRVTPAPLFFAKPQRRHKDVPWWLAETGGRRAHVSRCPPFADQLLVRHFTKALTLFLFVEIFERDGHIIAWFNLTDIVPDCASKQSRFGASIQLPQYCLPPFPCYPKRSRDPRIEQRSTNLDLLHDAFLAHVPSSPPLLWPFLTALQ